MISLEEIILLVIMACVVFLTVAMIVGAVILYFSIKKLQSQVDTFGKTFNGSLSPAVEEFRETSAKFRQLMDTVQGCVENIVMISMVKKVSPRLAGIKLGLDMAWKAYNKYQNVQKKRP